MFILDSVLKNIRQKKLILKWNQHGIQEVNSKYDIKNTLICSETNIYFEVNETGYLASTILPEKIGAM